MAARKQTARMQKPRIMADPTLSPWPRRVITIGGILRDWACQTLMGFGLVMLVALSIFAFDLDALYRFMARFSAQYVDAQPLAPRPSCPARQMLDASLLAIEART